MTAYAIPEPFSPIPESIEQAPISSGAKIAYGRLLRYAQKTGKAWPRVSTLAEAIGASVRQTHRYLAELKAAGLIEARRRGLGRSNVYRFPTAPGKVEEPEPDVDAPGEDGSSGYAMDGSSVPYREETKSKKTPQAVSFDSDPSLSGVATGASEPSDPPAAESASGGPTTGASEPSKSPDPIPLQSRKPSAPAESGPLEALNRVCAEIEAKQAQCPRRFNARQFAGVALRDGRHPEAVLMALRSVSKSWAVIESPWGYANRILSIQSGNFHERDHRRAAESVKAEVEAADPPPAVRTLAGYVGTGRR